MFTGITFCWARHLFNTTLIGPVAFEVRELCALVIAFCWTSQLFNTTLIGPEDAIKLRSVVALINPLLLFRSDHVAKTIFSVWNKFTATSALS